MALTRTQKSLAEIRKQIDAFDRKILRLIETRTALASIVAAAKSGGTAFRPGREADVLRGLIASSDLPPLMLEVIWRQIIANNLNTQKRLKLAILDDATSRAGAGFCFGVGAEVRAKAHAKDVLEALKAGAVDLGVLPHWHEDAGWLQWLGKKEGEKGGEKEGGKKSKNRPVYIVSVSPFLHGHEWAGHPLKDVAILAPELPDASAADETLSWHDGRHENQLKIKDGHHPDQADIIGIIQKRSPKKRSPKKRSPKKR